MTEDQNRVWGIHGGRTGDADTLVLRQARIALGWSALSSLANLPPSRLDGYSILSHRACVTPVGELG
jgi:hypothetical protein